MLCPGLDSNQHSLSATRPSSVRVYQFHHLGIGPPSHAFWRSRGGKYRSARESVRNSCIVFIPDGRNSSRTGPFPCKSGVFPAPFPPVAVFFRLGAPGLRAEFGLAIVPVRFLGSGLAPVLTKVSAVVLFHLVPPCGGCWATMRINPARGAGTIPSNR